MYSRTGFQRIGKQGGMCMAKHSESLIFSNAEIDADDNTIIELKKDETIVTSIADVIREWAGRPGLTISIKQDTQASLGVTDG